MAMNVKATAMAISVAYNKYKLEQIKDVVKQVSTSPKQEDKTKNK